MRTSVGPEGFVVPNITKIDDIIDLIKPGEDPARVEMSDYKRYYFLVWDTGGMCHRVEDDDNEPLKEKRKRLITSVNRYYAEPLDI